MSAPPECDQKRGHLGMGPLVDVWVDILCAGLARNALGVA